MTQVRRFRRNVSVGGMVILGAAAVGAGTGCEPSNSVAPGAALMLTFGAVDATAPYDGTGAPVYVTDVTAAGAPLIPPRSEFIATFDRLLDPDLLEDPATGGLPGVAALTSAVPGISLDASTTYSPDGDPVFHVLLPAGPTLTVMTSCGLPAGAAGTVQLNTAKLVSHDQVTPVALAAGVTPTVAFQVMPLAVSIGVPAPADGAAPGTLGQATPDTAIPLTFNALTPPGTSATPPEPAPCTFFPGLSVASHIQVVASVGGAAATPVAAVISQNADDATQWTVAPPGTGADGTGGAWPDGAVVTITVDAGATDVFNQPLGAPATGSFLVGGAS